MVQSGLGNVYLYSILLQELFEACGLVRTRKCVSVLCIIIGALRNLWSSQGQDVCICTQYYCRSSRNPVVCLWQGRVYLYSILLQELQEPCGLFMAGKCVSVLYIIVGALGNLWSGPGQEVCICTLYYYRSSLKFVVQSGLGNVYLYSVLLQELQEPCGLVRARKCVSVLYINAGALGNLWSGPGQEVCICTLYYCRSSREPVVWSGLGGSKGTSS